MIRLACSLSNAFPSRGQAWHNNNDWSVTPVLILSTNCMADPTKGNIIKVYLVPATAGPGLSGDRREPDSGKPTVGDGRDPQETWLMEEL